MNKDCEIPKEWKPAGSGEEELAWVLYDTEGGYNAANTALAYFDQAESAVGQDETNMPVANQLPSSQRFLIKEIHWFLNDVSATVDETNILDRAFIELTINNRRKFVAPLRMVVGGATIIPSGVTQDEDHLAGEGFKLERGIIVNGGDNLAVTVDTGETSAGTDMEATVALIGRLVRPA